MINQDNRELLIAIIDNYGIKRQTEKLLEEMGELRIALKSKSISNKKQLRNFIDEAADVLILIEQIVAHYNLETVLETMIEHKIHRTIFEMEFDNNAKNDYEDCDPSDKSIDTILL